MVSPGKQKIQKPTEIFFQRGQHHLGPRIKIPSQISIRQENEKKKRKHSPLRSTFTGIVLASTSVMKL